MKLPRKVLGKLVRIEPCNSGWLYYIETPLSATPIALRSDQNTPDLVGQNVDIRQRPCRFFGGYPVIDTITKK